MRSKLRLVFIALTLSLISEAKDYRSAQLSAANGMSQSEVYSFLEDRNGFMWIGTLHGLNRYDGYSFEKFYTDKSKINSLSNNTIKSLIEDNYGRIWIGTDNGLNFYDQHKELIYKIELSEDKKLSIFELLVYEDYLLVGTKDGLWIGDIKNLDYLSPEKSFRKVEKFCNVNTDDIIIRSLIKSKKGGVLVMTSSRISRIMIQNEKTEPTIIEEYPFSNFIWKNKMVEDTIGNLWIISENYGILRFDTEKKIFHNLTLENDFLKSVSQKYSSLLIDKEQKIWVGTNDIGMLCITYDFEKNEIKSIEEIKRSNSSLGLNSNLIYVTNASSKKTLWVGTIGSGVNILDMDYKKFQNYSFKTQNCENLNSNFVRSVYIDKQNRILIGTHYDGLYLYDRTENKLTKLGFSTNSIFFISEYRDNLYFICSNSGVSLVEINGSICRTISENTNIYSATFSITKCRDNIYWCSTLSGLFKIRVNNNQIEVDNRVSISTTPALSSNNCRVLYYDNANNMLLVGTESGGLNIVKLNQQLDPIDIKVHKMSTNTNSLSSDYVRSIIKDNKNNYWIGTYEGLNKATYNSQTGEVTFKLYSTKDGLPNNLISSIVEDDNNNLWLGTNGGLSKFLPEKERFINYNVDDGLQSNEFSEHAVFKSERGEIVLGGTNGINTFYPDEIKISNLKSNILITDFYLNNQRITSGMEINGYVPLQKSILYTKTLNLAPKHKNIGFKFSAMLYPNAGKIKYAYMLEGFDKEWKYTDAQNRNVHYTNLRHGKYTFKVMSTNTDGIWDENPASLSIRIKTPFYLTWVAIIFYVLLFILLVYYFSHYTVINLTTKRNLILEKEHNEKLLKLDELRTRFFINISHDLRTPLTLISGPLRDIMIDKSISGKLNESLQLIKLNVKRLTDLIEQLLDFRKAEESSLNPKFESVDLISFSNYEMSHFSFAAKTKGLELALESSEEKIIVAIDPRMIAKAYFNILSNAIKFTSNGSIKIIIQRVNTKIPGLLNESPNDRYIKVEVIDTGLGITQEQEKQIFDRFYQGNHQNGSGYGIGLSHTKDLIESHSGMVEAERNPKGGTIIRFFIPDKVAEDLDTTYTTYVVAEIDNNEAVVCKRLNEEFSDSGFKNILIVEDNLDILNYIKSGLKNNFNVFTANNGAEALKVASNKMPDLIVSDVMMPEMDGIEFCKAIKTNLITSHIPVILLTAKVDSETKYKGIENGADDYISKPFEMDYLNIRINNLLESRENLRRIFQRSMAIEPSVITLTSTDEKFLKRLMESIQENMSDEKFTINTLESQLGLSHSTFYRKIKTLTGLSAQEFLLNIRLKRAHQILSEKKGLQISEVSYMVGIISQSYFTKCFKEYFGYLPSEMNK